MSLGNATKNEEDVLVVKTCELRNYVAPNSVKVSPILDDDIISITKTFGIFLPRSTVENNTSYKQIIPYVYIIHNDSIYLTNRKTTQSEVRLHNKYSIGVGGHINKFDIEGIDNIIYNGMLRELHEEVIVDDSDILSLIPKSLISDDSSDVGKVHIGIVYQLSLNSYNCSVNETKKMEGRWIKIVYLKNYYDGLETWSQIIADYILRAV